MIESNWQRGIGLNLGGSGLIDLEADTPEGEMILDDICEGIEFPYYQARRGKHRIFQAHGEVGYLNAKPLIIEFRTGRHQSVLPPSPHPEADLNYSWIINPFDVAPPPLPQAAVDYYLERVNQKGNTTVPKVRSARQSFPYRDNLDYVLRHHELLIVARDAGIEFVAPKPDNNGNIPCFVPAALRGGWDDGHPSGVFNVNNGVLRDFSTGTNHLFFQMLELLTGEAWLDIFKRFEKEAGSISGRPHSRRIGVPTTTSTTPDTSSLEAARSSLNNYFQQELSRQPQPKTLHIIKGAPGVGKTYGICKALAEHNRRAIILTLENKLATNHLKTLTNFKGNASRMPVLRESPCPHPDEYEATSRRGFQPSHGLPCQKCKIGPKSCPYLIAFSNLEVADQLCCAAIYHTHDEFYQSYGNETRSLVIFDENCIDLLLAPQSNNIDNWKAWSNLLTERRKTANNNIKEHIDLLLMLVSWLESKSTEFAETQDENGKPLKFQPFEVPDELKDSDITKSPTLVTWLNNQAFKQANQHISNLYASALSLLRQQGKGFVLLERIPNGNGELINVRFRAKHLLPDDKEVFILDATANEEVIRAVAPDWAIKIHDPPAVEQKGSIIQIMDYDVSRNFISKQIRRHRATNPCWLVQVVDQILEKHDKTPIISFKKAVHDPAPEFDLVKLLANKERIGGLFNFPCRGHTFDDESLIVLGTPYKDEATIWELALAVYGVEGLPNSKYERRDRVEECFIAGNMGYDDKHLRSIQEFLVGAEISQAIGRLRPLQNECVIYVVTNCEIKDWSFQQFTASELFEMRQPLRRDCADKYERYCEVACRRLRDCGSTTNAEICRELDFDQRRGREHLRRFRELNFSKLNCKGHKLQLKAGAKLDH